MNFFRKSAVAVLLVALSLGLPNPRQSTGANTGLCQATEMLLSEYLHAYSDKNQVDITYDAALVGSIRIRLPQPERAYTAKTLEKILRQHHLRLDPIGKGAFVVLDASKPSQSYNSGAQQGADLATTSRAQDVGPLASGSRDPSNTVQTTVTGRVIDKTGEPLPGVSVFVKRHATIGVATGIDGSFSLRLPDSLSSTVIVFSMIGFVSKEVAVTEGQAPLRVVLQEDIVQTQEVVVVGYGQVRKQDLTGSVTAVDVKEIKSLPVASVGDAMQGRAAGLQVISQGTPGNDPIFLVRGVGTVNSTTPLIVIDGVPVMSGLSNLSNDDIESIQILKDASASAIYGARAANGVIIITTKRGKGQKAGFSINAYTGVQQPVNQIALLNAAQYANLQNAQLINGGADPNPAFTDPQALGAGTDWQKALFRMAQMQNINASYSLNSDKSNYYVSGTVFRQEGVVIQNGYQRYTLQFNADNQVLPWLKFGNNLTLNHDYKYSGAFSILDAMRALPTNPLYDSAGYYAGPQGSNTNWVGGIGNQIASANLVKNSTDGYNVIGNIYVEADLFPKVKYRSMAGLQANFWNNRTWVPTYPARYKPQPDSFASLSEQFNRSITRVWDNTLTWEERFDNHHLTVLAGTSAQANKYSWVYAARQEYLSDKTQVINAGSQNPRRQSNGGGYNEWAIYSLMARLNYDYKGRYLITATVRRDGSSRFGPNRRYGIFPSVSGAWRISDEAFMTMPSQIVSDLKIRAGWGMTGNQEIGNYPYASVMGIGSYTFGGQNAQAVGSVIPTYMPNTYIHWEATAQTNLGVDLSLLNNRITLAADAYIKRTTDMIVNAITPISTGYFENSTPVNAGKMENRGLEFQVSSRNLTGALTWSTSFNITFNRNKLLALYDTVPLTGNSVSFGNASYVSRSVAGMPFQSFYGYVTEGIFQTQDEVNAHATQTPGSDPRHSTAPGDIKFKDLNGDNVINEKDRTYLGNPYPKFIYGLNNSFTYKGFDLSIFLQGVQGGKIFNANRMSLEGMDAIYNQTTAVLDRWHGAGTSNSMPRAIYGDPNGNTRVSDRFIEDGSYLRIKNLTLGYSLPAAWMTRANMQSLRIYASCQNLFTLTRYKGVDPEIATLTGIDSGTYPVTRTFVFGLNIGI